MAKGPYERFGAPATATSIDAGVIRHVLVGDETISDIAAAELGIGYDSEVWRQVAEYNEINDLDALTAGMVIKVPKPQAAST